MTLTVNQKRFSGNVAISGEALDNVISFHQKDLAIASILLDNQNLEFTIDNNNEAVHVELPETGTMTLVLEFSGNITDNMTGIYPSYYTVDGVKKEVISTQFESHFAREAFPCVDEPEAKATFDLSIKFDQTEGEIVLSNMPEVGTDRRKETDLWTFDTTPRMSSYLLAFALGDLQGKTAKTKNGTEVGVFSTKAHALKSLDFALDIAVRVIDSTKIIMASNIQFHFHTMLLFLIFQLERWKTGAWLLTVKFIFWLTITLPLRVVKMSHLLLHTNWLTNGLVTLSQ